MKNRNLAIIICLFIFAGVAGDMALERNGQTPAAAPQAGSSSYRGGCREEQ